MVPVRSQCLPWLLIPSFSSSLFLLLRLCRMGYGLPVGRAHKARNFGYLVLIISLCQVTVLFAYTTENPEETDQRRGGGMCVKMRTQ